MPFAIQRNKVLRFFIVPILVYRQSLPCKVFAKIDYTIFLNAFFPFVKSLWNHD